MPPEILVPFAALSIAVGWLAAELRVHLGDRRAAAERDGATERLRVEMAAAAQALTAERSKSAQLLGAVLELHGLHARQMAILHRVPPWIWSAAPVTDGLARVHDDMAATLGKALGGGHHKDREFQNGSHRR